MSNLSDLLPAGASAKQITATDSGSGIASKAPVIMNASGTVAAVGIQPESLGSAVVFETGLTTATGSAYDATNKKVVISYRDEGNSNYGTAVVGTVSGTSISFGTPVVFEAASVDHTEATFDSGTGKIVLAYQKVGANGSAIVGTVSGTSISFGTAAQFDSDDSEVYGIAYDSSASKVVISYVDTGNTNRGTAVVGTVSGTSISFGTPVVFDTGNLVDADSGGIVYDITNSKVVLAYRDASNQSHWGAVRVGTVSGTSISFGTKNYFSDYTVYSGDDSIAMTYDSTNSKVIIIGGDGGQSNKGSAHVGTVSGTTISFGTKLAGFTAGVFQQGAATFDSTNGKVLVIYQDNNNSSYGTYYVGTVSGTSISFGSPAVYESATTTNNTAVFDSDQGVSVFGYRDQGNSPGQGTAICQKNTGTNLTAQAFVGVADSAISASAAGSVIVQGGTVTGVEVDPAVTTGSQVVFDDGGATTYISSGFDPDNNKVVHAFCTTIAHAIVGTVSGTSVTYGTAVQINSNASDYTSTAYDTANDRVVIVYSDNGDSYGYASVGTVSGTSITFGTKVVFSTASSNQKSVVYDANAGKVLIVYRDGGGGDEVKGIVGTVDPSDNSISFGSAATAAATQNFNLAAVYDSNAQKTVVVAQDYTDSTGTAYVATITGTSVSFGTGVDFLAAAVNNNALSVTFNSTDNKVIVGYGKASDNKGYLITGTVSGTSIGFAGETAFSSGTTTNYISLAYKAAGNILGIVYNVSGSSKIRFNNAVISGTSFSFGTEQDLVATTTDTTALILDETADNFVASYGDGSNNYDGTTNVISVSTSAVIGTKYYVTPTGGFSSTAGTPSVNAGLAISTTQLLLNGDS